MRRTMAWALGVLLALQAGVSVAAPCAGFTDVEDTSPFCPNVTWLRNRSITFGCAATLYCPNDPVTRLQMAAFMNRLGDSLFPLTCAAGQVMKWDGLNWACANDNIGGGGGGGTVTSVAAGTGLQASPNPITTAGAINVAPSYQLPQACANGQVAKSNGAGGWTCAADTNSGGTVMSLTAGTGITLTPNPITTTGTIAVNTAAIQQRVSAVCSVGSSMRAILVDGSVVCEVDDSGPANAFVHGGNAFGTTAVLGTSDNQRLEVRVNNLRVMRYEPNAISPNVIGGSPANNVSAGVRGATIAGGGVPAGDTDPDFASEAPHRVSDAYGTVGGGYANVAGDGAGTTTDSGFATVGGGNHNTASGPISTVGGGGGNAASGGGSTVGGGVNNVASGLDSTVPGGSNNTAGGNFSVAMGYRAKSPGNGSFTFADSNNFDFSSVVANAFHVRATGGIYFVVGINGVGAPTWSCLLFNGAVWQCSSDRNLKQDLVALDGGEVLAKLAAMPVYAWSPKGTNAHVRHYGPMAQDFHAAFGLGDDDKMIGMQDADGVALAAIQGLNAKLEAQARDNAAQRTEIAELRRLVQQLIAERQSTPAR